MKLIECVPNFSEGRSKKFLESIASIVKSNNKVNKAKPTFPVRKTLVAPILPEPISRMSPSPDSFVVINPKGIEPIT